MRVVQFISLTFIFYINISFAGISDSVKNLKPVKVFVSDDFESKGAVVSDYGSERWAGVTINKIGIIENINGGTHEGLAKYNPSNDKGSKYVLSFMAKPDGRSNLRLTVFYKNLDSWRGIRNRNYSFMNIDKMEFKLAGGHGAIDHEIKKKRDGWVHCYFLFEADVEYHNEKELVFAFHLMNDPENTKLRYQGDALGLVLGDMKLYNIESEQ